MKRFNSRLIIFATFAVAAVMGMRPDLSRAGDGHSDVSLRNREVIDRDKRGTSSVPENEHGPQVAINKPNTNRGSLEAEGRGLSRTAFRISRTYGSLRRNSRHFNKF